MAKGNTNRYDVVVIGSGLSGLTCANFLVREGKKVLLLEQAHQPGGCMSGFRRKGFYFDGGDQSIESGGVAFPILKELDIYDLHKWEKCEYRVKSPKTDFLVDSIDTVEENFQKEIPGDPGIKVVFKEIKEFAKVFEHLMALSVAAMEQPRGNIGKLMKIMPAMRKWSHPDFRGKLCSAIQDPVMRNWFSSYGYSHMPFHLFAGFWHFWVDDYWYPSGGIQSLMNNMLKKMEEYGGEARFKTSVKKILVENGEIAGVLTDNDEKIEAGYVVYTGDYKKLVSDILGEQYFKPAFVDKVNRANVTESFVAAYLGLDIPTEELKTIMKAHHVVTFPGFDFVIPKENSDIDVHSRASIELSAPSFADSSLAPEGKSSLVLQTFTNARWQNYWHNNGFDHNRTPEYKELKKLVGMQLVKGAESIIPNLSSRIDFMDVSSPLTIKRFTRNTDGATAGWSHDQSKEAIVGKYGYFKFRSQVKGLYTAGHYSFWPGGIPSVISSGKFAANFILKKDPFAKMDRFMTMLGR